MNYRKVNPPNQAAYAVLTPALVVWTREAPKIQYGTLLLAKLCEAGPKLTTEYDVQAGIPTPASKERGTSTIQ